MCKYCEQRPKRDVNGYYRQCDNQIEISEGGWVSMYIGVEEDGIIVVRAEGDSVAEYYPNYCPECGRKLEYRRRI